jgi:CDP-diacylglycerol--glycerol-3-phosphate 3-phosphatidyltransferase
MVDPIADKALIGGALVGLSVLGELPWWVTVLVLVREIGVTLLRFVVIRHGVMPAGRGGKLKTVLQVVALTAYLLPLPEVLQPVVVAVMAVAVLVTLVTGAEIAFQALRLRTTSERADAKRQARAR